MVATLFLFNDPLLLQSIVKCNVLDLCMYKRFSGHDYHCLVTIPLTLIERGAIEAVHRLLQTLLSEL